MLVPTLILFTMAGLLLTLAWRRGDGSHRRGLREGWWTFRQTIPLLFLAFLLVGLVDVLIPRSLVEAWIGPRSGWRGIGIAEVVGIILPGGPYVIFPLISSLYQAGAGLGPTVAIITSWAMLSAIGLTFEVTFMGWRFALVRWSLAVGFPLLAGLLTLALQAGYS